MSDRPEFGLTRRALLAISIGGGAFLLGHDLFASEGGAQLEPQPYFAQLRRIVEILRSLGEPVSQPDATLIQHLSESSSAEDIRRAEKALERYTLLRFQINEQGNGSTAPGAAAFDLVEQGWRTFLVRVENPFSHQGELNLVSDAGIPEGELITYQQRGDASIEPALPWDYSIDYPAQLPDIARRWLGYRFYSGQLMPENLSGLALEYRVLQLFSRDRGKKSAYLQLLPDTASRPQWNWLGQRRGFEATFNCLPSRDVQLDIKDWDGRGCMASILIKDEAGRIYPAPGHRFAPDFDFQPQVYRADGESVRLPAGRFSIETGRGPEYLHKIQWLTLGHEQEKPRLEMRLERWFNAAKLGWYPGDTHIHASGCMHYAVPTRGVTPETMIRHVRGEALSVGDVLIWGPGYNYQKNFFSGRIYEPHNELEHPQLQKANNTSLKPESTPHDSDSLIRYDVEVSGFPSSHSGHLVLLGLRDQNYPGAKNIEGWPSWNLPILQWARSQGAVVGYAHCGVGLSTLNVESVGVSRRFVESPDLPNYEIPLFNGIGANEYLVDVTHDAVDFVSGTEMPPVVELNFWYHALNCGFRTAMVGETDFPCASDARIGNGRTYVGLDRKPEGEDGFNAWVQGIRRGRLYFGDGFSHFIDFRINGHGVGEHDLELQSPGLVTINVKLAARLNENSAPVPEIPAWNIEHARIGDSRKVKMEVVVNGKPVANRIIEADGSLIDFTQTIPIERSSWVALRILRSGHSAPIYVKVADKPIRASKRSARWCLDCLDVLWREKAYRIRDAERNAALAAYQYARGIYKRILGECEPD